MVRVSHSLFKPSEISEMITRVLLLLFTCVKSIWNGKLLAHALRTLLLQICFGNNQRGTCHSLHKPYTFSVCTCIKSASDDFQSSQDETENKMYCITLFDWQAPYLTVIAFNGPNELTILLHFCYSDFPLIFYWNESLYFNSEWGCSWHKIRT